jgi:RHS repeat-associated protein
MTRIFRYAFLMIALALAAKAASAQVTTGTPPFGSFGGGPDVIDLANLNSHFDIPVLNKAGRGVNFTYDLIYDNSVWYPITSGSTTNWQPAYNWGWHGQTEIATGYISYYHYSVIDADGCTNMTWTNWIYHDAWGVPHPFVGEAYAYFGPFNTQICTPAYFTGFTNTSGDGSGFTITVSGNSTGKNLGPVNLYGRDGRSITAPLNDPAGPATSTDRNGNFVSVDGSGNFTDTLGQVALTVTGTGTPSSPMKFTYTAPSGAAASYTMNYTNYTVATNVGVSGISEYKSSAAVPLVTSIVLPDNSQYTIQYEATPSTPSSGACTPYAGTTCVTARIKSVTLPTGGSITYTYTGGNNGVFADGSTAGLTRALSDGASWNATWTYSRTLGTGAASTDTVVSPLGDQTVMQFQGIYETQRQVYQGTSTLLETVYTCYNGSASPCTSTAVTLPIASQAVTNILPGSANLQSKVVSSYNTYGQLSEEDDYAYGTGAPGSLLRKKLITIQTVGTYQAIQTAKILDGSGNTLAQTTMTFDQGNVTATSGTPQHTNPTVGRGNPTTISYLVQGSTALTKTFTYFDTGNAQTATDVNGAQTTFTYGACGNSFPTSISEPLGLSQSMAWNCTGGVETSVTDENTKVVSTSYTDPYFWRPANVTDPTSAVSSLCYGLLTSGTCTLSPNKIESTLNNSGNSAADTFATLDGIGRAHINQTRQAPGSASFDSGETDYDVIGRPNRFTTPYSAAASQTTSPSAPATTTTYDALGRVLTVTDPGTGNVGTVSYAYSQNDVYQTLGPVPLGENAKRRQSEYDSLGRLISVCEITAGTTAWPAGACGQNTSATGYLTKYTYNANGMLTGVTQNAQSTSNQQTRGYTYDDLSRMTSETNPESGTTSYFYDSTGSSPCLLTGFTSNGDLLRKADANGTNSCNWYDSLHRLIAVQTNRGVDGCKRFVYDITTGVLGSPPSGVSVSNVLGRLAEVETDTCAWPITQSSIITDEWFSYTSRGEISDEYEATQHSGGYYHVAEAYWANGVPSQLSGLAGLPTISYGVDGEGRPNTVSASSGQNPVTGTNYNPYGSPPQTTVTFGSGDSDVFNFDSNTGRMTQYKFNVGSQPQSVAGALTWNPNGSLGSLAITDPFNSANAQTCNYVHDDLERIAGTTGPPPVPGVNCVNGSQQTVWSQTFSFDPFGNINKAGNSSFAATYSPATNRMTTIGTSTPTYDADGNVLNDFLHTYTWNADGRPLTIDGVGVTYDALGRMVEHNYSGTYYEIAYAPTGEKLANMYGQTLSWGFIALPGGATALYTSSGLSYYRHPDWLGSVRLTTTPSRTMHGDVAYAPYGETYAQSGSTDLVFTGKDQASTSNEYDFPAREYGIQGRWPSPDPLGLGAVNPGNPQSWNRYAYVGNNPLAVTDPTGMGGPEDALCPVNPVFCVVGIIDTILEIFRLFGGHHHVTPHAAPAPPGGYGAGIDPYGTWDESLPAGVQVFPSSFPGGINPGGSGCPYGSGSCGGMIYSLMDNPNGGTSWWNKVPFLVGLAKTFRWKPSYSPNNRPIKVSPQQPPTESPEPAPGQNPEGGINQEMKQIFDKFANWAGSYFGSGKGPWTPWGESSAPAIIFPGEWCIVSPATCHNDETF